MCFDMRGREHCVLCAAAQEQRDPENIGEADEQTTGQLETQAQRGGRDSEETDEQTTSQPETTDPAVQGSPSVG